MLPTGIEAPRGNEVLWRYIDLARFVSLLSGRCLHLNRIDRFDDKWEGTWPKKALSAMSKQGLDPRGFVELTNELRSSFFVSCWHANPHESAALWDLYASKSGVAIQTTGLDLEEAILDESDPPMVGAVRYVDFEREYVQFDNVQVAPFLKRKSFDHEKEVRVVRWALPMGVNHVESHRLEVDLQRLIKNVYVSPTAGRWQVDVVRDLCERYRLDVNVVRSELYDERVQ